MEEQKKRRARRKFTEEFKARAVRLVLKEGQTGDPPKAAAFFAKDGR